MSVGEGSFLMSAAVYLGAAVVAVPIFKRLGLGSVLGYLAAGTVIGPFGIALIHNPENVLHFAEFGVVLLLFVIGLELKPARLWVMRRDIFGLGLLQVVVTGAVLTGFLSAVGLPLAPALVAGSGLALSSTAFALQILEERGTLNSPHGNTAFAILLFQDLAIVPLLALVAFLTPQAGSTGGSWLDAAKIVGAVLVFIIAGRYILRPVFRIIALTRAREIFTAAALLLIVGAAVAMEGVGLSMAMGAFLAGVLLADSEYRHQLEADIEPFRGLLLGLFFIAVGMSIDWSLVASRILFVAGGVIGLMATKGLVIFGLCRLFRVTQEDALRVAVTIPQGGEFAFVLFTVAAGSAVMDAETAGLLTAVVTLSMAATPLAGACYERIAARRSGASGAEHEDPSKARPQTVIVAGFGRVGQIVAQFMHARGIGVTAIDHDPERIEVSKQYCNKVYFGDVRRPDVLAAAGAGDARLICICVDDAQACNEAIRHIRGAFPTVEIIARAFDRNHVLQLLDMDIDCFVRETFESSVAMGKEGLRRLGVDPALVDDLEEEFRRRDQERFAIQQAEGEFAGTERLFTRYDDRAHNQEDLTNGVKGSSGDLDRSGS